MRIEDWCRTASTDDLFWHFHNELSYIQAQRAYIVEQDLSPKGIDAVSRGVQLSLVDIRLIVAELRRRGERVEWEE